MAEKSFGNASGSIKRVYYAVTATSGVPGWPGAGRLLGVEGVHKRGGIINLPLTFLFFGKKISKRLFIIVSVRFWFH